MKIVHLARDEKFLPLMRTLFNEAFPGANHYVVVQPRRGPPRFATPSVDLTLRSSLRLRTRWIARDVAAADMLVAHSMTTMFARTLRHVRPGCVVVWIGWGYDYMPLLQPRLGPLLLPETAALMQREPPPGSRPGLRGWWQGLLRGWRGGTKAKPPALVSIAPRIDVFSANPADARGLREALPALRAVHHVIPSFTVEDVFAQGPAAMAGPDILLGNSATPANNHLEALALLRGRVPPGGRVIAPLSYGQPRYRRAVEEAARAALGECFESLADWLPIGAYNERIARCGFVLMNHCRQQAVGNISAALYKGATVYLRRENPLFGFYSGLGAVIRAVDTLIDAPAAALEPLSADERQRNRSVIEARYRREQVVAAIRALQDFKRLPGAAS